MIRVVYPGSGSWFFTPSRIPDPEVKKAPDPGSGTATLLWGPFTVRRGEVACESYADPSIQRSDILIRVCVVATGGSKDYGFTLFASQLNEMEEDVAATDSRFRLGRFSIILWRMRCLFHEVWDTTEYTEWRTHIYSNRLADLPAVDSRISPEMLVHSRCHNSVVSNKKIREKK